MRSSRCEEAEGRRASTICSSIRGPCVQLWACTPAHEQTQTDKNSSENCHSVPLFTGLLNIEVCPSSRGARLSVCPFALLLACDGYTEPIQARSGLIDARYICLKSRTARVESGADIAELGHSDCPS